MLDAKLLKPRSLMMKGQTLGNTLAELKAKVRVDSG